MMTDTLDQSIREYIDRHPEANPALHPRPFDKEASITVHGGDFANAVWAGDADLPVPFSYCNLEMIEKMPWKLIECGDDLYRQTRWYKRA